MSYLNYLNMLDKWLETNYLTASAQLMYIKLLMLFNRAGWQNSVVVDNRRLALMINASEKSTIIARDELVKSGFITYEKGKKGKPNRYFLIKKVLNNYNLYCKNYSENDSIKGSTNDSENDSIKGSHTKSKNKNKTKSSSSSSSSITSDISNITDIDDDDEKENEKLTALGVYQNVMLSNNQIEMLLEKMTLDEFDYYVDKLDRFIFEKDARVKNHCGTMLHWCQVDRGTKI